MTDADDLVLLINTHAQTKSQLHCLEQAAGGISCNVNANKCVLDKKEVLPL